MARRKSKSKDVAPDAFQQEGETWVTWLEDNIKIVVGGIVVVLAGVIGLEYMEGSTQHGAAIVTGDLAEALEDYREATSLRKVLTSTSAEMLNRDFQDAADKLARFQSNHPQNPGARIGAVYEADLLARMGKHAEAETKFAEYANSAKPDDELLFFALEGLGYVQEAQDKHDAALRTFERLATEQPFMAPYALKHQGRVYEAKGDKAGAAKAYQGLVEALDAAIAKKYESGPPPPNAPESQLKRYAETRLKAVQ